MKAVEVLEFSGLQGKWQLLYSVIQARKHVALGTEVMVAGNRVPRRDGGYALYSKVVVSDLPELNDLYANRPYKMRYCYANGYEQKLRTVFYKRVDNKEATEAKGILDEKVRTAEKEAYVEYAARIERQKEEIELSMLTERAVAKNMCVKKYKRLLSKGLIDWRRHKVYNIVLDSDVDNVRFTINSNTFRCVRGSVFNILEDKVYEVWGGYYWEDYEDKGGYLTECILRHHEGDSFEGNQTDRERQLESRQRFRESCEKKAKARNYFIQMEDSLKGHQYARARQEAGISNNQPRRTW